MIRTALLVLLTLLIAICGGAASVAFLLDRDFRLGATRVGVWTAHPEPGAGPSDPYARAAAAVEGVLPLGRDEGLALFADADDAGEPLRAECTYRLSGDTPLARFWTLSAEPAGGRRTDAPAHGTLQSRAVLRDADNGIDITVGAAPAPGNWLRTEGSGRMRLVLTVYDAPLQGGPATLRMPSVARVSCDG